MSADNNFHEQVIYVNEGTVVAEDRYTSSFIRRPKPYEKAPLIIQRKAPKPLNLCLQRTLASGRRDTS